MATFSLESPPLGEATVMASEEEDASALLANALQKMDGLIGDYSPPQPPPPLEEPLATSLLSQCEQLKVLVAEFERRMVVEGGEEDPRGDIPPETKELLVNWLSNRKPDTQGQLQRDKEELLKQVVTLQEQVETVSREKDKLSRQVAVLERRVRDKEQHIRSLSEELKAIRAALQTKEAELRFMQDHSEVAPLPPSNRPMTPGSQVHSQTRPVKKGEKGVTIFRKPPNSGTGGMCHSSKCPLYVQVDPLGSPNEPQRSSFRKSLVKAFGKRKAHTATLEPIEPLSSPLRIPNPRAAAFYSLNAAQLGEWFQSIGLDIYSDMMEQGLVSGDKLATIVSSNINDGLVQIGIVSTMHCKKVRLAVEAALADHPSPLDGINHKWVADWLKGIGLPQYQRMFLDGRIDGRMLNFISLEDLRLLDVTTPFHIVSLKRGIQAFRQCGYNADYLKEPADKGSQKLLHWSAEDLVNWIRSIELDEYVEGFENMGIHGAVMLLDVQFNSESLAKALGIGPTKTLIRKHLSKKFVELIGPIAAQKKMDAMQTKGFQPLDPTEQPKGLGRSRSRSFSNKRGKQKEEELLCPLEEFPASELINWWDLLPPTP